MADAPEDRFSSRNILSDPSTSDAYLALIEDERRDRTIPALIALEETLCDGRDSFAGGCVFEGGTQDRCECVFDAIADAVLYDGVPVRADGTMDVDAATSSCDE